MNVAVIVNMTFIVGSLSREPCTSMVLLTGSIGAFIVTEPECSSTTTHPD